MLRASPSHFMIAATLSIEEQITEIRKMLRATMNGVVSSSLRQQGLSYRMNFGVDQPRLLEIAQECPASTALAQALWKTDTRELRLLAPILMPQEAFDRELAKLWIEQVNFAEEAQVFVMHLLSHLPYASELAFELVASDSEMQRLTAWLLFARLFMGGAKPTRRDSEELLDHLETELLDANSDPELRRTALNTLYKYMDLGEAEEALGERILQKMEGQ